MWRTGVSPSPSAGPPPALWPQWSAILGLSCSFPCKILSYLERGEAKRHPSLNAAEHCLSTSPLFSPPRKAKDYRYWVRLRKGPEGPTLLTVHLDLCLGPSGHLLCRRTFVIVVASF
jgi:hypothetical protein